MYAKILYDGYIAAIGTDISGEPITADEYNAIISVILSKPTPPARYDYRLRSDLTWELVELPTEPKPSPDDELDDSEALNLITGGVADGT